MLPSSIRIGRTDVHDLGFYVSLLLLFIFCYWRILITMRRQASVMAGHAVVCAVLPL